MKNLNRIKYKNVKIGSLEYITKRNQDWTYPDNNYSILDMLSINKQL